MTSTSSLGSSIITLQFNLNENIDVEEQQVQAAINAGTTYLPRDLPNPPIYSKVNPADSPIITLALMVRLRSREPESFSSKVVAALRNEFGGHAVKKE